MVSIQWLVFNGQFSRGSVQRIVFNGKNSIDSIQRVVFNGWYSTDSIQRVARYSTDISIYKLGDVGITSKLIGSLSLTNEQLFTK